MSEGCLQVWGQAFDERYGISIFSSNKGVSSISARRVYIRTMVPKDIPFDDVRVDYFRCEMIQGRYATLV
jgi:hypothetical protein